MRPEHGYAYSKVYNGSLWVSILSDILHALRDHEVRAGHIFRSPSFRLESSNPRPPISRAVLSGCEGDEVHHVPPLVYSRCSWVPDPMYSASIVIPVLGLAAKNRKYLSLCESLGIQGSVQQGAWTGHLWCIGCHWEGTHTEATIHFLGLP